MPIDRAVIASEPRAASVALFAAPFLFLADRYIVGRLLSYRRWNALLILPIPRLVGVASTAAGPPGTTFRS